MKSLPRLSLLLFLFGAALRLAAGSIERTKDTVSLDYSAEKRVAIMRDVADQFEMNLVVPDRLPNEKIDLKLQDVTCQQALAACVRGTGFVCLPRENTVWLVGPDNPLGEFFQLRDRLDRATEETYELRGIIGRLTRGEARPVTAEQRAQIQAFLDNPTGPATELLPKLGPDPSKSPAAIESSVHEGDTLSIDFPNENCAGILSNVADLFELHLVVPSQLRDLKMSVKLRDVSWRRIFELCLLGSGYIYVARGDSVTVVRADEQLGEFGQMRAQLDRESAETPRLRKLVSLLTRSEAPALTEKQRGLIEAFLKDPASSAAELLPKLQWEPARSPAAVAK